jgi:hypothetical protein
MDQKKDKKRGEALISGSVASPFREGPRKAFRAGAALTSLVVLPVSPLLLPAFAFS